MTEIKSIKEDLAILLERTESIPELALIIKRINTRLESLEIKFNDEIKRVDKNITELKASQDFISYEFEKHKTIMNNITNKNILIEKENIVLKNQLTSLTHQLDEEKAGRNEDTQYHRTSLNVKVVVVPLQIGEDDKTEPNNKATLAIISKIAEGVDIVGYHPSHIDVCHRVLYRSKEGVVSAGPIIIRFTSKRNRFLFFNQKNKLKEIKVSDLQLINKEMSQTNKEMSQTNKAEIFMQESLTRMNSELLRLAKEVAGGLHYKYAGYVVEGQVRVKIADKAKFIAIRCKSDLDKIQ